LPMCQFAYFVGKMTHRPDARRQNEPASIFYITLNSFFHQMLLFI
jgi:hypothetical protein